ncbi:MAG TPA: hypothetical protein VES64_04435, partial [Allosphingosinicella sp.]|nr:hypothetical protein [Allosphingosinicella sp.]
DLFELIDGLLRGIVFFFYNLLGSWLMVIRHPFRGPPLLYRAYNSQTQRQVSSFAFLFASFSAAVAACLTFIEGNDELARQISAAMVQVTASDWWWIVLLSSLCSSVVLDAGLRVMLQLIYWKRFNRSKRPAVIAKMEYALAPAALLTLPVFVLLQTELRQLWHLELPSRIVILTVISGVLAAPALAQLPRWSGTSLDPAMAPTPQRRVLFGTLIRLVLVTVAFAIAVVAGAFVLDRNSGFSRKDTVWTEYTACHLLEERPYVDLLLHNKTSFTVPIEPRDLFLYVGGNLDRNTYELTLQARSDPYGAITAIGPGETKLTRLWVVTPPPTQRGWPPAPGTPCHVGGDLAVGDLANPDHELGLMITGGEVAQRFQLGTSNIQTPRADQRPPIPTAARGSRDSRRPSP